MHKTHDWHEKQSLKCYFAPLHTERNERNVRTVPPMFETHFDILRAGRHTLFSAKVAVHLVSVKILKRVFRFYAHHDATSVIREVELIRILLGLGMQLRYLSAVLSKSERFKGLIEIKFYIHLLKIRLLRGYRIIIARKLMPDVITDLQWFGRILLVVSFSLCCFIKIWDLLQKWIRIDFRSKYL